MASMRRKATLAGIGLAGAGGVLAFALMGPGAALADPTPSPSASASASASPRDHEDKRAERQDALAEALAKELGIDKAKVAAALEKVHSDLAADAKADRLADLKTRLDQAVTEGTLTREQADAILKAAEAGVLPHGGGGGHHGGGPGR
jgi:ABC-type phosphate/phosphonate transport system substrate-binding protein